jgi:hypothetical protein
VHLDWYHDLKGRPAGMRSGEVSDQPAPVRVAALVPGVFEHDRTVYEPGIFQAGVFETEASVDLRSFGNYLGE